VSQLWDGEIVRWQEQVLRERYGLALRLEGGPLGWSLSLVAGEGLIRFDADALTFTRTDSQLPFTTWHAMREGWTPILGKPLPAPGAASLPSPLIERTTDGYVIHYDILGLTYWMLTRKEEVGRMDLDKHGRFPASSAHAFRHGYLERPIVDEWLDILRQVIERTWPEARLKQRQFSIKVSHDVDAPARHGFRRWLSLPRCMAGDVVKRRDPRALVAPWIRLNTRKRLHPWDAGNTFDWLMDVSESHGLTSAFYFICERRGTAHDADYDVGHPAIRCLIRRIHARGHEVGLHPGYATFLDPAQIKREAERLRRVCAEEGVYQAQWGGRMHYLQWRHPVTMRAWNEAGMNYDSTLTYADRAGFRCGTCFEYPAFDPVGNEPLSLRIRPLVVMEGSVIGQEYMDLGVTSTARDKMLDLKSACRAVGGCFTLLWHNSVLLTSAERELYEAVVAA
jgi:hypothetical protein